MSKYKIGDKVRVRSDLRIGNVYGSNSFVTSMDDMRGKVATISDVIGVEYHIAECGYLWTDEMFEGLVDSRKAKFEVGDYVTAIEDYYGVTNTDMTVGKVINVQHSGMIDIEIIDHVYKYEIGGKFPVRPEFFKKIDYKPQVVEPPKPEPKKEDFTFTLDDIMFDFSEDTASYILIGDKVTIALPPNVPLGIATRHPDDTPSALVGKAVAFKRMVEEALEEM